ncbi:centrosomal protein of 290 kDa-like isoform X1 [Terrapene carolina triunguis]|uniref:centrosomal protein of 290 kDa-like isoform X1 n=1 Tax=Terrapene triunguis TaxID=2587831 RepID=UPI000E774515|nr:centrosomal protein of 290 kDa-like isoform X1 [Terrapene carolina triunguis]
MELPTVHKCLQLNNENEQLLRKLKRLRRKNQQLENDLAQIQEKLHLEQLMHDYVTSRDVQVQTESHLWHKGGGSHNKEMKVASESARILQTYNNLQKHYDREIKINQEQSETIKNLTIKIHELEHQLQLQKQRIEQLECKKVSQKDNTVSGVRTPTAEREVTFSHRCICKKKEACSCKYLELLLLEIQKLKKKNEKLSRERRMQRNELPGLDKEFFDEIEDLKYALQESIKLNNQYEKCLKHISSTYGFAFAAPYTTITSYKT